MQATWCQSQIWVKYCMREMVNIPYKHQQVNFFRGQVNACLYKYWNQKLIKRIMTFIFVDYLLVITVWLHILTISCTAVLQCGCYKIVQINAAKYHLAKQKYSTVVWLTQAWGQSHMKQYTWNIVIWILYVM